MLGLYHPKGHGSRKSGSIFWGKKSEKEFGVLQRGTEKEELNSFAALQSIKRKILYLKVCKKPTSV